MAKQDKRYRRCILTMQNKPVDAMIRLVLGPDGQLVPDVAAKLPGRGIWISAERTLITEALERKMFVKAVARALKSKVSVDIIPPDLCDRIETLLEKRCLDRISLEQRAGHLITGFDKIKAALKTARSAEANVGKAGGAPKGPSVAMLIAALDGADDGRRRLEAVAGDTIPVIALFDREQLSRALGRDNVVHALLFESGGACKLKAELGRFTGFAKRDGSAGEA